ncbi:MAG: J domain-containing protein [Gemmataceae bacterium]
MPTPYDILGLPPDAPDEAIRQRYLQLTREFPPEQHPQRFAAVRAAYEKIKDIDARVRYRLFDAGADDSVDAIIEEAACPTPRRRFGLSQLLMAAGMSAR